MQISHHIHKERVRCLIIYNKLMNPWAMPGYDCDVIMAAGAFISGASIELSADAPMHEPYTVYFQGGLSYDHAKFGILKSLARLEEKGLIDLKNA